MIVPDTNLLIYAYDSTSPHHDKARNWWEGTLSGSEPVGLPCIVILAFVRLMTHPSINHNPLHVERAQEVVTNWLSQPYCRILPTTADTMNRFFKLTGKVGIGGNLCTDAMIAATAMEYGGTIHSNDRDFDRFEGIEWFNPL